MLGRRLDDAPLTQFPLEYDELQPGDYWLCQTLDGSRLLNVIEYPDDRRFWAREDQESWRAFEQNLTGLVMGCIDPAGQYGMLSIHTVRLEDDGTVSVRPGDGSSNSILITGGSETTEPWHGYIEHGVWQPC